jgi:hypothetical protein
LFQYDPAHSNSLPGIDSGSTNYNADSLKRIYGKNKTFISEYELPSLIALSHYPELKETHIVFKLSDEESTGKTTIAFTSLFQDQRKYIIYINRNKIKTGFLLNEAPLNAQVAVIGHELAHILDFSHKDLFGLIGWAIRYSGKKQRKAIDRNTDLVTIQHGLGKQLYEWSVFALNNPNLSDAYKKARKAYYLQPDEILALLNK